MALRALETKKGGLTSRSIKDGGILPSKLSRIGLGGYAIEPCNYAPQASTTNGYSLPTGGTGDVNVVHWRSLQAAYFIMGAGQTILAPRLLQGTGLTIGLDEAAAEGVEYAMGGHPDGAVAAVNPFVVTIGTSPAASIRATLAAGTVANVAELAVGFRKVADFLALIDDYTDMAVLNMQAGVINRETILNNAATEVFDTGEVALDSTDFTLEVQVHGRRARFLVNDAEVASGAPFDFDTGDTVIPFIHFLQDIGASNLYLRDLEVGPLYVVGKDPARR